MRVGTHGDGSWERVEYRRGAYHIPPDLARALDAGAKEGLELSLPLSLGHPAYAAESAVGVEAFAVDAIDTTGAGDAFCGNLAARLASGATIPDAAKWSCAAGALAATAAGAVPSLPRATDVRALLGL